MTAYELVALVTSHALVSALAWELCRRRSARKVGAIYLKCRALEAESTRTVAQMRDVREQFRGLEHSLIHVQLLMEQAQERVEQRQTR